MDKIFLYARLILLSVLQYGCASNKRVKINSLYKLPQRHRKEIEVYFYSFLHLGSRWDRWLRPRLGRFNPRDDPLHIV